MEFSRQEYWSGLPFPSPGDLPYPGIEPRDWTQVSHIAGRFWREDLVGYSPRGHKELDTTEWLRLSHFRKCLGGKAVPSLITHWKRPLKIAVQNYHLAYDCNFDRNTVLNQPVPEVNVGIQDLTRKTNYVYFHSSLTEQKFNILFPCKCRQQTKRV